ncbi:Sieve element occlusion C-terminal protein [Dioscorea alata]|uniref:Sieve element occlusion C-terminal protein n=1 Tax=Dioscorea alata TaxID=55571 RepID=A0ACB7VAL8_DIOAL|nr:Sieve element occlusion C-terminal protein [Dioscorea alata]
MSSLNNSFMHLTPFSHEDILIRKILQTHMPDGRLFDAAPFLDVALSIVRHISKFSVVNLQINAFPVEKEHGVEIGLDNREIGCIINHIACEHRSSHSTTMAVLESVEKYSWGMKAVIVLVAFAMSYGQFWLVIQLYHENPLALCLAMLKGIPKKTELMSVFENCSKPLIYLFEKMVDLTKCMLDFEILPVQYTGIDYEATALMKTQIHLSSYWVMRSAVACTSQITSTIYEHINPVSSVWELWSLAHRISYIHYHLKKEFDSFKLKIEKKIKVNLIHLLGEVHDDNQKVLSSLFALKKDFPLKSGLSKDKVGVDVLINKEVILFISRPNISLEKLLFILQQLQYDSRHENRAYDIVWVPIAKAIAWSHSEKKAFSSLLELWPWYLLYEPTALSLSVIEFIKDVWQFHGDPVMVVLDFKGKVTSLNAIDMISIWRDLAYPFSVAREKELWVEQSWTMELLIDNIYPLIMYWMDQRKIICLHGSSNINWIRELTKKMKAITNASVQVELIYVGCKDMEITKDILSTIISENLSNYLPLLKIYFFWTRLECMKRSKLRLGYETEDDTFLNELSSLLSTSSADKGWLLVGAAKSKDILRLTGNQCLELLSLFDVWGEYANKFGILGAMRQALAPPIQAGCGNFAIIPHVEEITEDACVCKICNALMEKYIMYQCTSV